MTLRPGPMRLPARAVWVAAALLLALFLGRLLDTAIAKSLTVDEPHYIGRGLYLWHTGNYHFEQDLLLQAPLAYHIASVPLLFLDVGEPPATRRPGPELLERKPPGAATLRFASRLPFALLACWGGLLCFLWAREASGDAAGLLALSLYTFSPTLLAHGGLVHSDVTVSVFYLQTLYTYWRWTRRPTPLRLAACGASLGLALLSKLSAVILLPTLGLLLLAAVARPAWAGRELAVAWPGSAGARALRASFVFAALLAAAVAVIWLGYGGSFALTDHPGGPLPDWHLPAYLRTLVRDVDVNAGGRHVYFLGRIDDSAPWYYFPVAFGLKVPLGTLALLGLALASLRRRRAGLALCVGAGVGLYAVVACFALVAPLGIRYVLPIFPLLFVFLGAQLPPFGPTWRRAAVAACLLWIALTSLRIHPHYLAYFNEVAGGPSGGHRYLIESNLDWGQDLGTLARWLADHGDGPVRLAYFGPEPPQRYGIRFLPLPGCQPASGTVAISVNVLLDLYYPKAVFRRPPPDCHAWLRELDPVARLGHSIYVYEVPRPQPAR